MKKFAISILLLTFAVFSYTSGAQCPPIRGRFSSKYTTDLSALYPRAMWLMPSRSDVELNNGKGKAVFLLPVIVQSTSKMSNKVPAPSAVLSGSVPRYELIASDALAELMAQVNALSSLSNVPELLTDLLDRVKFQQSQTIYTLPRAAEILGLHAQTVREKVRTGLLPSVAVEGSPRRFITQAQLYDVIKRRAARRSMSNR